MNRSVLFVITGLGRGGAESQLVRIAIDLRHKGWKVAVLAICEPTDFLPLLGKESIEVYSCNIKRGHLRSILGLFAACKKLKATVRLVRADVLVCFMFHAYFFGRVIGSFSNVPVVSSVRTEKNNWVRRFLTRITDKYSCITVFNSRKISEKAVRKRYVSEERVRVIPNGVDTRRFALTSAKDDSIKDLKIDSDAFVWVSVGRLERPKDYPNLLRAFLKVKKSKNTVLLIAGKGSQLRKLQGIARKLRISERVHFLGEIDNIPGLLSCADALVISSAWEGLPNSLLEALASGLPAVSTDVGGVREVMNGSSTCGFVVRPKNSDALADAMLELMQLTAAERRSIGQKQRERILNVHDFAKVVDSYEGILLECIERFKARGTHKT